MFFTKSEVAPKWLSPAVLQGAEKEIKRRTTRVCGFVGFLLFMALISFGGAGAALEVASLKSSFGIFAYFAMGGLLLLTAALLAGSFLVSIWIARDGVSKMVWRRLEAKQ